MEVREINPTGAIPIRDIKQLKTKKARDILGLFMVEGAKFVDEIPPHWHVLQYVVAERYEKSHDISHYQHRATTVTVRDTIFDGLADAATPQGVIALCQKQEFTLEQILQKSPRLILLGENLNDPGNIGALIRTAAAAGAGGVILTLGSGDIYNPKVLRAAAGAVLRLPFVVNADLAQVAAALTHSGIPIYAAHPRGTQTPYGLDFKGDACILVGHESHGISDTAAALATGLVTLPMVNRTESLNASVAGSILLYEAVRQRL